MNNAIYRKAIQVNNEIDYLKSTSKPSYLSHQIFDNNLVGMDKSKLVLKLNVYCGTE